MNRHFKQHLFWQRHSGILIIGGIFHCVMSNCLWSQPSRYCQDNREQVSASAVIAPTIYPVWKVSIGKAQWASSPALDRAGNIIVGGGGNLLYAIRPDSHTNWTVSLGGEIKSSPAIGTDGRIYVGSTDKRLYAISSSGKVNWAFETGGQVASSPAIDQEGMVYFTSLDGNLYSVNPNGGTNWVFSGTNAIVALSQQASSPAIGPDGTIYVGINSLLYAVNPDGTEKWRFQAGTNIYSSPAIGGDGTIYFGSDDTKLYAVNPSGDKKWEFKANGKIESSPIIGPDGAIYFGTLGSMFCAVNANGQPKFGVSGISVDGLVSSSAAIDSWGRIYVGTLKGTCYVLTNDFLVIKAKFGVVPYNSIFASPLLADNGMAYVVSQNGYLFAFQIDCPPAHGSFWPMFRHDANHTACFRPLTFLRAGGFSETNRFDLLLSGPLNTHYEIEYSANLSDWAPLTSFTSTNQTNFFWDQPGAAMNQRYYRAVQTQQ